MKQSKKDDRTFLNNLLLGAAAANHVQQDLIGRGFKPLAVDRGATDVKIWDKTIKKLRVPDFVCLKTGVRIESRGKNSSFGVFMSDSDLPWRRWDAGLRDEDVAAFVKCKSIEQGVQVGPWVCYVSVRDLRATYHVASKSARKDGKSGSEFFRIWPKIVPGSHGRVEKVTADAIHLIYTTGTGRAWPLRTSKDVRLHAHVQAGDTFGEEDRILATVGEPGLPDPRLTTSYDFSSDLTSPDWAVVLSATRALGALSLTEKSKIMLKTLAKSEPASYKPANDENVAGWEQLLLSLEAALSLAIHQEKTGFDVLNRAIVSEKPEEQIEAVLRLGELPPERAQPMLEQVVSNAKNNNEVRSAALWMIGKHLTSVSCQALLQGVGDENLQVSAHSVVRLARSLQTAKPVWVESVLNALGSNSRKSAGIVRACSLAGVNAENIVDRLRTATDANAAWLTYLLVLLAGQEATNLLMARGIDSSFAAFVQLTAGQDWTTKTHPELLFLMEQLPSSEEPRIV